MSRAPLIFLANISAPPGLSANSLALRAADKIEAPFWQTHWLQIGFGFALLLLFLGTLWFLRTRWRERAVANAKLEASQGQLRMVLASAGCELWRYNVLEQIVYRENVLSHVSAPSVNLRAEELIQAIHPDDRKTFNDAM